MNQSDNRLPFSQADIRKVLGTDEGKKLIAYLSRDGGAVLKQAAEALKRGDQAAAQQILSPMMQTAEAQELVDKINRK
ncbi:MAG: hypothetical protein KH420_04880 [Clostridiales bacterium]|mgnify:CR=1 FL=1|nr:hypothetical protein [Clostridiales bacterium]